MHFAFKQKFNCALFDTFNLFSIFLCCFLCFVLFFMNINTIFL